MEDGNGFLLGIVMRPIAGKARGDLPFKVSQHFHCDDIVLFDTYILMAIFREINSNVMIL